MRACIGRPFAWQEAQLAMVTILQHFDLVMDDPNYELEIKQTITIKPNNFHIHAIPRKNRPSLAPTPSGPKADTIGAAADPVVAGANSHLHPLYVLYGSNTGSSESFAQRLVSGAPAHGKLDYISVDVMFTNAFIEGFRATLQTLDMVSEHVPTDGPVLIVTASYEGQPADNAKHFVEWLENIGAPHAFDGAKFGVFGCGNRDWVQTYQRIPTLIDRLLADHGALRLVERGEGDAASAEFFETFDEWEKSVWETLGAEYGAPAAKETNVSAFDVKTVSTGTSRAELLRQRDLAFGTVIENKTLTAPGAPTKRHIGMFMTFMLR